MGDIWNEALQGLQPRLGEQTYEMWLRPLELREVRGGTVLLSAPTQFHKDWFVDHFRDVVLRELAARGHEPGEIEIEVRPASELPDDDDRGADRGAGSAQQAQRAATAVSPGLASGPASLSAGRAALHARNLAAFTPPAFTGRYIFDTFIRGPSNDLAASAALAVADDPGGRFNPLFLYGGAGLGKTHLMHAVGHTLLVRRPDLRIAYLSAEQFMNEYVAAVRSQQFDDFRARYREGCDCLLIDDIQFISGRDRTMEEFFHVFNALYEKGKQIMVTADRMPSEMQGMEERLTSRLNWGLVADIKAPDLETRLAILQAKAERESICVDGDVLLTIAEQIRTNVRELEGALVRVHAHAELRGIVPSVGFVRDMLGGTAPGAGTSGGLHVDAVVKATAAHFGLKVSELKGNGKQRSVSHPRMVAMWLCRELTSASFPEIGARLGGKDHSTVMHACKRIPELLRGDPNLAAQVSALRGQLQGAGEAPPRALR
jgi:chromosomal replication initiator protein